MSGTEAIRSVLVVVTRQIGDVLLTTPLIHEAKRLFPDARVDVLGFEGTLGMLRGNPDVHEIIAAPAKTGIGGALSLARRLWRRWDLVLVAEVSDRAHLIGWIAGRRRAGILPEWHRSNWWKRRLLDHVVVAGGDRGDVHVVDEKVALLAPWQSPEKTSPRIVPPAREPLPEALSQQLRPVYVVVHSPSMWPYKQWPLESFRELVIGLQAQGRQVVLTGGPGPIDRECVAALQQAAPDAIDVGVLNFGQLATLIGDAALYVGPDTSVSHLAAAKGTPVVAVFGPTNPKRWSPWGENVTVVQATLPCVPCSRAGCEDHRLSDSDCLHAIPAVQVLEITAARCRTAPAPSSSRSAAISASR